MVKIYYYEYQDINYLQEYIKDAGLLFQKTCVVVPLTQMLLAQQLIVFISIWSCSCRYQRTHKQTHKSFK